MTIPTITDVITKSRDLLVKQGKPAINGMGGCSYRTPEGLACAVGILLSDTDAAILDQMDEGGLDYVLSHRFGTLAEVLEDGGIEEDWELYKKVSPEGRAMLERHSDVLQTMQVIHDQCQGYNPQVPVANFVPHITEQFNYLLDAEKS